MAVVLDIGSAWFKGGFAKNPKPTLITQTNSSSPRRNIDFSISNWQEFESFLHNKFKTLEINIENHSVLLNNQVFPYKSDKERITQILFEKFRIPLLNLSESATLTLYSCGKVSGLVLHSGFAETQAFPVYEGHVLYGGMTRGSVVAGKYLTYAVTDWMQRHEFNKSDITFARASSIKEEIICVNTEDAVVENLSLPDGTSVKAEDRISLGEELFTSINSLASVQDLVINRVYKSDPTLKIMLLENIVLEGGTTLIKGFARRLKTEIQSSIPELLQNYDVTISEPEKRDISPWLGGSVLAAMPNFKDMCMTLEEYDEKGPGFVHTKFF